MTGSEAGERLQRLLAASPSDVLSWLDGIRSQDVPAPPAFNWRGLAGAAAARAREAARVGTSTEADGRSRALSLGWAQVAAAAYERLAREDGEGDASSHTLSEMALRAYLIASLGPSGDELLEPGHIYDWFTGTLPLTYEEAREKTSDWRGAAIEDIRALRALKNRITVLQTLRDAGVRVPESVAPWLGLKDKLP
jgi:hypothetical protein